MKPTSNGSARAGRRISPANERRKEPRFDATGVGILTVLNSSGNSEIPVDVINISRSGFQVELAAPLETGTSVALRLGKVMVFGEVVSCRACSECCHRVSATTTLYLEPPRLPKAGGKLPGGK